MKWLTYNVFSKQDDRFWLIILFIISLVPRVYFMQTTELVGSPADGMCRLQQIRDWMEAPYGLFPGGLSWLPLHHYLVAGITALGVDMYLASRLLGLVLGVGQILILYLLVKHLFNRAVAFLTALLLALNAWHIAYSTYPMTEVTFLFFAITAVFGLFKYLEYHNKGFFYLSAFAVCCASLIRFEGWIFAALLPLYLVFFERRLKSFLHYIGIVAIPPIFYLLYSKLHSPYWISGLATSNMHVKITLSTRDLTGYPFNQFYWDPFYPEWLFALAGLGILLALIQRRNMSLLLLALILVGLPVWKTFNHTLDFGWRYFSTGLTFLLPFCILPVEWLAKRFVFLLPVVLLFVWSSAIDFETKHQELKKFNIMPDGYYGSAKWIKANRKNNEKVLYDIDYHNYCGWQMTAGLASSDVFFPPFPGMDVSGYKPFTGEDLISHLRSKEYDLLAYKKGTVIDSLLKEPIVKKELDDLSVQLNRKYQSSWFEVWEISFVE